MRQTEYHVMRKVSNSVLEDANDFMVDMTRTT